MSGSGFSDEAASLPGGGIDRQEPPGRSRLVTALFAIALLGLLAFAAWAWAGRVHADDVAAYESLDSEITVFDRSFPFLTHSEKPPCRDEPEGTFTRTYSPSTEPEVERMIGYLIEAGWRETDATPPTVARLTKSVEGRDLTLTLVAPSRTALAQSLRAVSTGSSLACLGRS